MHTWLQTTIDAQRNNKQKQNTQQYATSQPDTLQTRAPGIDWPPTHNDSRVGTVSHYCADIRLIFRKQAMALTMLQILCMF